MENVRQQVYESCKMDFDKSVETTAALHTQITNTQLSNQSLTDELDELEQYSRRNCLVFHGLPESTGSAGVDNTTGAKLQVVGSLGVQLDPGCIDRCHRMGPYVVRICRHTSKSPPRDREVHYIRATQSHFHRQAQAQGNKVCHHGELDQATYGPTTEGPRFCERGPVMAVSFVSCQLDAK